jgi:hypothetical protein
MEVAESSQQKLAALHAGGTAPIRRTIMIRLDRGSKARWASGEFVNQSGQRMGWSEWTHTSG